MIKGKRTYTDHFHVKSFRDNHRIHCWSTNYCKVDNYSSPIWLAVLSFEQTLAYQIQIFSLLCWNFYQLLRLTSYYSNFCVWAFRFLSIVFCKFRIYPTIDEISDATIQNLSRPDPWNWHSVSNGPHHVETPLDAE